MKITEQAVAGAQAMGITPVIVGLVRSSLKNLEDCPHWQDEGPEATLEIFPPYIEALDSMQPGQRITLVTWLHQSSRNVLRSNKHGRPPRGVFSSRSPVRPNPVGLHDVTVAGLDISPERALVRVNALEALDGTPILDIKTTREHFLGGQSESALAQAGQELVELCRMAGAKGLMPGFSGNASLRVGEYCLVTRSGAAKERLAADDLVRLRISDGQVMSIGARPSSEAAVHLQIYRNQPLAQAILHTHPACLLALGVKKPNADLAARLALPVFEAEARLSSIGTAPRLAPGGADLGEQAGLLCRDKNIIWLEGHGLCVWGASSAEALSLSEEIEHLAKIALLAG